MMRFVSVISGYSLLLTAFATDAVSGAQSSATPALPNAAAPATERYAPGLGDFMTAYVQPHHIKLWLAGNAANWALAAYEAGELGETFDDIKTYQPSWHDVPVARLVKTIIEPQLTRVDAAISAKDLARFRTAYRGLTAACNSCHVTTQHGFLDIRTPGGNYFSDQNFTPKKPPVVYVHP